MLKKRREKSLVHVKTNSYKEAVLYSRGSVCPKNLGGSCLQSAWCPEFSSLIRLQRRLDGIKTDSFLIFMILLN